MRWLYHLVREREVPAAGADLSPASLSTEGFVHCSYRDAVRESARLYFPGEGPRVLRVDPRRLSARIEDAATPRGPMPHVHGPVPADAIREVMDLDAIDGAPDRVLGTRFVLVAFAGMTLLDLVGVADPLSRVRTMNVDDSSSLVVVTLDQAAPFADWGTRLEVAQHRPSLAEADVLVIAGGPRAEALAELPDVTAYLATYPENRLAASVCSGALLLGAAGRLGGRRATTHASVKDGLARYGATAVEGRVVTDGNVLTAGGVTCGIDLGLALVALLYGDEARATIATQMEWPLASRAGSRDPGPAR